MTLVNPPCQQIFVDPGTTELSYDSNQDLISPWRSLYISTFMLNETHWPIWMKSIKNKIHFQIRHAMTFLSVLNPQKDGGYQIDTSHIWKLAMTFWMQLGVWNLHVIFIFGVYDEWRKKNLGVLKSFFQKFFILNFFFRKFSFKKKFFFVIFEKIPWQNMFGMVNLNLEWFQLSFDVYVVYVGKKLQIFQNWCIKS